MTFEEFQKLINLHFPTTDNVFQERTGNSTGGKNFSIYGVQISNTLKVYLTQRRDVAIWELEVKSLLSSYISGGTLPEVLQLLSLELEEKKNTLKSIRKLYKVIA